MLLEFRIRNYRSIRDEIVISFVASKDKKLAETHLSLTGIKSLPHVVRSAVVYGPNASGKSTLLQALLVALMRTWGSMCGQAALRKPA